MLNKISKRVYIMLHNHDTDRPVLGLIIGDKYSLVVDAGNSPKHAREFLQEVGVMKIPPLKYLILTHWHWDHVFGLADMNLTSISNKLTQIELRKMKEYMWDDYSLERRVAEGKEIEFCSENIKKEMTNDFRVNFQTSVTDICFATSLELDLGGVVCVFEKVAGSHSEDSTIIYVQDEKVMFLGDCISEDYYSGPLSYDFKKFKSMIEKISKYDTDIYLNGHREPENNTEFWKVINMIDTIGNFVGDDLDENICLEKYKMIYKVEPSEEISYYIKSFICGNKKRL
ncbi:MAG: MBL fold metallo-hydrolase [Firmicutes bacterium]|nr:MBL fold metallo-hydrolase [Bacillota bacterium]